MTFLRAFWLGLAALLLLMLALPVFYFLQLGSGASAWTVSVPLAGTHMQVKVQPLLRAATSPAGRRLLDGTIWQTAFGPITVRDAGGQLVVKCAPCSISLPAFSANPLQVPALRLALARDGDRLDGTLSMNNRHKVQRLSFNGKLNGRKLKLDWVLPESEAAELLSAFQSAVPELRHATIRGKIMANGTLQLPDVKWAAVPALNGFAVYGLGTERLRNGELELACRDANGWPVKRMVGETRPEWIGLDRMGKWLPRAVVAAEDAAFYRHAGYDVVGLMQVMANPDRREGPGAGTITQQLAKYLFIGADKTGSGKLRELLYAVEMERTLGKRRILALYLNTVEWGPGLCGVSEASQTYFTREPADLAPLEAAWLAGILKNPQRAYQQEFLANKADQERLDWVAAQIRYTGKKKPPAFTLQEAAPATADPALAANHEPKETQ